ncbi:MAG: OsmC family protein [Spirochaetes bacterium]|nr:OsmC family protein [Spirochaetota bacterium]
MNEMKSRVTLKDNMHFDAELEGFHFNIDADPQFGGTNQGPKPKGLVLTALCGCTAMDVISILRKMRAEPEEFWVEAETTLTEEHPKVYQQVIITYHFKGGKVTEEKARKAIEMSQDKYCGVNAMLKKATTVDYKIIIE